MEGDKEIKSEYDSPGYWFKWLTAAKKGPGGKAERHRDESKAAWAEFTNEAVQDDSSGKYSTRRLYPIYYSTAKVIAPALYALTPTLIGRRRFGYSDDVAREASTIVEDLGEYLLDQFDFDSVMYAAVNDFIHAGKSTVQLIYKTEISNEPQRVMLVEGPPMAEPQMDEAGNLIPPPPAYLGPDGQPWPGEVMQDAQGFFGYENSQKAINQSIHVAPICYDEVLHTPDAKIFSEIVDIAYKFKMTRLEAEGRFKGKTDGISWQTKSPDRDYEGSEAPGEFLEGWEIYCKNTKKVYWLTEQKRDSFLDVQDDPYELDGFFPCPPFAIDSKPDKSLYPTPAYQQARPILEQLHGMVNRVFSLIQAVRRRALVDGANTELIEALNNLDAQEFFAVENFRAILEKGGVANLVQYIEVQDLVNAITELVNLEETFKNWFFEWFRVPDILRGTSDPIETAKAQEIKQGAANDSFKYPKKQIAQLARDSIRMMVDLALKVFDDTKMMSVCGFQYKSPEEQALFPQALAMLRSDKERVIRLDIDTNSLTFYDRQLKKQENTELVTTITQGLEKISAMLQTGGPAYANTGLKLLMCALDSLEGAEDYMEDVRHAVEDLIKSHEEQAQQPPPPSDKQIQAESDRLKTEAQERMNMTEYNFKMQELQLTHMAKMEELRLMGIQLGVETQLGQMDAQLKAVQTQIDQYRVVNEAQEKIVEELRLGNQRREQELNGQAKEQQPIVINNIIPPKPPTVIKTAAIRDPLTDVLLGAESVVTPETPEV